jgi:uncharacterized protein
MKRPGIQNRGWIPILLLILLALLILLILGILSGGISYAWRNFKHPAQHASKFSTIPEMAQLLKDNPSLLNARDDRGDTPLGGAIVQERVDMEQFLLDNGADPNIPNQNDQTALEIACSRNKNVAISLVKPLLAKGAKVNPPPHKYFETPLGWAVATDNTELVELLLSNGADPMATGGEILRNAADRGETEIAKLLIDHGADVNSNDASTPLLDAAEEGQDEIVKLLLARGAKADARVAGDTPLLTAASRGHPGCVELLIAAGADVNAADNDGNTGLHYSAAQENEAVVQILLAHGANINARNKAGQTPLQLMIASRKANGGLQMGDGDASSGDKTEALLRRSGAK